MFAVYVTGLITGVYLAPGLALFPRVLFDSRIAFALPLISVLIVTLLARALKGLGLFLPEISLGLTVLIVLVAVVRVWRARFTTNRHWPAVHTLIYAFSCFAVLPIAVKQGLNGFSTNDEIYSWNVWAIGHLFGEPVDRSYTSAPYPQSFPYLIAWCYQLVGSIDLQLPLKACFAVLSASAMAAIGVAGSRLTTGLAAMTILLLSYLLYVVDIYQTLSTGLAEVLMIPALTVSVALFITHERHPDSRVLILCAMTGLLAGLSKQPALIWLMLVLPVLSFQVRKKGEPLLRLWPVGLAWAGGLLWLLTEGMGFQDNRGVLNASQQGRELLDQLGYASELHLLGKPAFLLLLVGCTFVVHTTKSGRGVFWLLLMPSLVAWLIWGAYNTRLGVHVMMIAGLLIVAADFGLSEGSRLVRAAGRISLRQLRAVVVTLCLAATVYAVSDVSKELERRRGEFSFYDAPKNIMWKFFGSATPSVLDEVFRRDDVVWAGSAYVYGIFYKQTPLARSIYSQGLSAAELRRDLWQSGAAFAVDDGDLSGVTRGAKVLRELLAGSCGEAFQPLAASDVRYRYTLYRIDRNILEDCTL